MWIFIYNFSIVWGCSFSICLLRFYSECQLQCVVAAAVFQRRIKLSNLNKKKNPKKQLVPVKRVWSEQPQAAAAVDIGGFVGVKDKHTKVVEQSAVLVGIMLLSRVSISTLRSSWMTWYEYELGLHKHWFEKSWTSLMKIQLCVLYSITHSRQQLLLGEAKYENFKLRGISSVSDKMFPKHEISKRECDKYELWRSF